MLVIVAMLVFGTKKPLRNIGQDRGRSAVPEAPRATREGRQR
ncbi:hypothetical protein ACU4GD_43750 [Cupriavidus basilensis]